MLSAITLKNQRLEANLFKNRLLISIVIIACLTIALISRLFFLQLLDHSRYETLAEQNRFELIPIEPNRGLIFDRNGVLIAKNRPVLSLEVTPARAPHLHAELQALKKRIALSPDEEKTFLNQLHHRRRYEPVVVKIALSASEVARFAVERFNFPGFDVRGHLVRTYPLGNSLAPVLGYVGRIDPEALKHLDLSNYAASNYLGKTGLERRYEDTLHGQVGYHIVETNAGGQPIRIAKSLPPIPGDNLYLSIDSRLQHAAQQALQGLRGAVVAVQPSNGALLALYSNPSYDPNQFVRGLSETAYHRLVQAPSQPLYNRALRGQYPLASTIKPFIALAGLRQHVISADTTITDPGWYRLPHSKHRYRDWRIGGHGAVNVSKALIVSCDTFFYRLAHELGIGKIDSLLTRFGFGTLTGIDSVGEKSGLIPTPGWKQRNEHQPWYPGDTVLSGIGQGYLLTTPLQLAEATAMLASQGKRFRAHLVSQTQTSTGTRKRLPRTMLANLAISPAYWQLIVRAMANVIRQTNGTGHRFGPPPKTYSVAAKTGTAQVFSKRHDHVYRQNDLPTALKNHSLFIAFAPLNHPQIAIAVVVEHSNQAPRVARQVLDQFFNDQHLPPS